MAKPDSEWKVLAHGQLQRLSENLWWVEGALPGMSLKRCMTVARMTDGRLVLHSAIALDEAGMTGLLALGTPAFLVVPSRFHRLDAARYKQRFPELKVLTPRAARSAVEQQVAVDGDYDDLPADDNVQLLKLDGLADREGALRVRSTDGVTLVFNDAVFNMDKKRDLPGYIFTTLLGSAPGPRVSRLGKMFIVDDKKAFRAELERLAATKDLVRVIVGHEKVASGPDARTTLLTAATYL